VTSPQAFEGLRLAGRTVRRPDLTLATRTTTSRPSDWDKPIADPVSRTQVDALRANAAEFGVRLHSLGDVEQGIVHIIGPQLGLTQPGMTIVCGDSHTSTHGAFGAIAFGIGTSEVEHVLATQTLMQAKPKTMAVTVTGSLPPGVTAKDLVLTLIAHTGTGGGQGYIVEYRGEAIEELSMEARMTICNMSIEWGAKAGLIAPDQVTFDYVEGRPEAPKGADWDAAVEHWRTLVTDEDAQYDKEIVLDASTMTPFVTWGTNPGQGVPLGVRCPTRPTSRTPATRSRRRGAGVHGPDRRHPDARDRSGHRVRRLVHQRPDRGPAGRGRGDQGPPRREGHAAARRTRIGAGAAPGRGRGPRRGVQGGRRRVARRGCSMCLGMNPDQLQPGERSASTSNRNFEGRRARAGARTWSRRWSRRRPRSGARSRRPPTCRRWSSLSRPRRPERWTSSAPTPAWRCRCGAATSTPTRSSRRCTSSG
jgi:3-isopropylmalate/(R)-2-methylmalate dehydratase large subunit